MTTKIKLANNVADVDLNTTAPTNGQALVYSTSSAKWIPGAAAGGGVTVYSTIDDLPLSGVDTGALALVDSTNKLYLWMDTGWYNIATINIDPEITAGNNTPYILATDGTPTVITLIASDPEGIPLTWSYEVTSGSLTNGGGTTATVSNVDNVFTVTPTTTEAYAGAFSLTFKASDGVNLGTTVAAFTLAFRIPDSNYTTLLAKGVAATQNATFVDSSTNAHTITANGDVYQGTFSPYREGGYSMYFDGSGDYLSTTYDTSSFDWWTGDYTIEAWVYPTTFTGWSYTESGFIKPILIGNNTYSGTTNYWSFGLNTSGNVYFAYFNGAGVGGGTSSTATLNAWNHIALVISNGTITLYLNGVGTSLGSISGTPQSGTGQPLTIGAGNNTYINGYVSNLRIVKGTAVYTSNFTPPTEPLTAITNTSLLINTPYIADSSTNAHAITVNGNTSTQPFSPFNYQVYDEAINGGSAYFDGTGDYLDASSTLKNLGVGDFCIEFWVYTLSTNSLVIDTRTSTNTGWMVFIDTVISFYHGSTARVDGAIQPNAFNHVAITRSSGTLRLFVNGTQEDSTTYTADLSDGDDFRIGYKTNSSSSVPNFFGYLSSLRIVAGSAVYTSNFTPPTAPLTAITNTSLLLNFTNAGVQDYSQVGDLKLVGNATGSNTQTKYASYSMYFDGTGDYITLPPSSAFTFGTGDFTIEGWIYLTGLNATANGIFQQGTSFFPGSVVNTVAFATLNTSNFQIYAAGAQHNFSPAVVPSLNTWYHFAVVRSSGTTKAYINGTSGISVSDATDYTGTYFGIGNIYGFNGYTQNGYIEDLRITKGLARYTSNFTPPTSELLG